MLGSHSDIVIRRAFAKDVDQLVQVFQDSWRLAYGGIIAGGQLDAMIARRDHDWWACQVKNCQDGFLLLEVDGTVAGYSNFGVARGRALQSGEIYELYIAPAYQGMGLGENLFEGSRYALDLRSLNGLIVWALADNHVAQQFYWNRGGRPAGTRVERLGSATVDKVCYTWD
jgi:GNAT superfamily N-acetyltransferase